MASLSPSQLRTRERVESLIRLAAPALDLLLAAGDRVSRIVEREDAEHYPHRLSQEPGAKAPVRSSARTASRGARAE